ncbi:hypothetical protein RLOC_00004437 [Lonchura striata]|uniref:Uncharacterized protein n=1 Tax=Lonchura striata TaxID=40157 RepID=A0A218U7A8_9PASE|nr:hypothetical protein RLOC_00004437 [Lonchura striata domestica]
MRAKWRKKRMRRAPG